MQPKRLETRWRQTSRKPHLLALLACTLTCTSGAHADFDTRRPDSHAPLGVMGDHTHEAGEWMLSYRYMHMRMDDIRDGTSNVSIDDVLQDFPVTMTDMDMEMHMVGVMYAPTDRLTLVAMLPYTFLSMDHRTRTGTKFTTKADGPGDLRTTALYHVYTNGPHRLHLNAGISFPTGSIEERDNTPADRNVKLPYPMQLGSGTFDLIPGVTYLGMTDDWSWGFQPLGTIRLSENSSDYTLGDRVDLTLWLARRWTDWLSNSVRLHSGIWFNIEDADPDLDPAMVPTADPDRRAGERLDLLFGLNLYKPSGFLQGHRLAIEGGFPVYESLDGPQLRSEWQVVVGWQASFGGHPRLTNHP